MEELLDNPLVRLGLLAVVVGVIWKFVSRFFAAKPELPATYARVRCYSCGWEGTVGKYKARCSQCNGDVETL